MKGKTNFGLYITLAILLIIILVLIIYILHLKLVNKIISKSDNNLIKDDNEKISNPIIINREVLNIRDLDDNSRRPPVYPDKVRFQRPINEHQQVGILINIDSSTNAQSPNKAEPVMLPLFGRIIDSRRDRWDYYAAADKNHLWRVPVFKDSRDCSEDVGCYEIQDGDIVSVPSYEGLTFKATIYKKKLVYEDIIRSRD